jgi:hypothetical protein
MSFALLAAGCGDDDNPVNAHQGEEHAEAIGLIIRNSGAEIVRYENGKISGEIDVGHGKETALLSVRFIAEDGDLFTPHTDDGFSLGWEIVDETVAKVDWHPEDGAWAFHIVGEADGKTTIRLKIMHEGHADFVSMPIEIHVSDDGPGEEHDHD